jgi:two-component system OmpR family sensor kinase
MPFRRKLILWYAGLLAVIIVVFGFIVYRVMEFTLISAVDETLDRTAELVIRNSRVERFGLFGAPNQTEIRLPLLDLFSASGVGVQVWDMSSQSGPFLKAASNNLGGYNLPLDPRTLGHDQAEHSNIVVSGYEFRVLTRPIFSLGQVFGSIQVVAPLDTVNHARERMLLVLAGCAAIGILGSVILGMWLSGRAVRPINRITEAAARIAKTDDLSTRLSWDGPRDELGRMTEVFNQMMDRLEDLFGLQRRFVADVSHELRTPLTAIRGNLDLIRRYGADEMSLEAIESEAGRMYRMVEDLLLLARADYGGLTLDMAPIDLDSIVTDALQQARVLVRDRDLRLTLRAIEPVRVSGNSDRMKQVMLNLLGNAIRFTPDGGTISLSLQARDGQAVIQVSDTGIGIAPEDQKHIFDRFYRVDTARVSEGESTGLGLAIARWIVEAHGGHIRVESALGQGSTFTIEIPLLDSDSSAQADSDDEAGSLGLGLSMPRRISNRGIQRLMVER